MSTLPSFKRLPTLAGAAIMACFAMASAQAAPLAIRDTPLFIADSVPPLNMLVVGRDHKLYYEAYNDASDLDGDGELDVKFKPSINYYGYFDTNYCYSYSSGVFVPVTELTDYTGKCSGQWHGNFLNYITTARIDALRKVLYGGFRRVDTAGNTVLERTHIPQDAHGWGKEYSPSDGYDIADYTIYSKPADNERHFFASITMGGGSGAWDTNPPLLRVRTNQTGRIWNWVTTERAVTAGTATDYTVRVQVCTDTTGPKVASCRMYPDGHYKPVGLLQEYGENDSMYFGLLTGSYEKNTDGGVLRKAVGSFTDEVDASTGVFLLRGDLDTPSIIRSLDGLRTIDFSSHVYSCGWVTDRPIKAGECRMWGNPVGEMLYETLRYFAGKGVATAAFDTTAAAPDLNLGLTTAKWDDPYQTHPRCSKPFSTVISDINPSYDTDKVPGAYTFDPLNPPSLAGDIDGLDAEKLGQTIWDNEKDPGGGTSRHFIGQSGTLYDGTPKAKDVTSLGNIRGLSPEEPTKMGGYYAASMAFYGNTHDLSEADGEQRMQTFSVALASPLPKIEIPVGGSTITLVPFAKSVGGGYGINADEGKFQPTNQIVDFYVETITPTFGRFRVNFEDVEQGADHDMDAIVIYEYVVNGDGTVTVTLRSEYAAGGIVQHMGYVISGTDGADGIYLEVRDTDTCAGCDTDYFLDTPGAEGPGGNWKDGVALPIENSRTFSPGTTAGATLLKDPLWYAAKWGGFQDKSGDGTPDAAAEWDADKDGTPDNYFLVTNALNLKKQLETAFDTIQQRTGAASSASVNSGTINEETRIYQAQFRTGTWSGDLVAYPVNEDGSIGSPEWRASDEVPEADAREIFTVQSDGKTAVDFKWAALDATRQGQLDLAEPEVASGVSMGEARAAWLRGDHAREERNGGLFRDRVEGIANKKLGDFISSSPTYVGAPRAFYSDLMQGKPYSTFKSTNADRDRMIYAGANDGMLHAFDADTGEEKWAFIPGAVFANLHQLTDPAYQHRFFVDGATVATDAWYGGDWHTMLAGGLNNGGQGVYVLDVTQPDEADVTKKLIWEFTDADHADLGQTYARPTIAKLANGKWYVIFGNGYNNRLPDAHQSTTGNAVLFIVGLENKNEYYALDTGFGEAPPDGDEPARTTPNGLSSAAVVDVDDDGVADYVYGGDLYGNLWKFDLRSSSEDDWGLATNGAPLFVAQNADGDRQPITTRPQVGFGPRGTGLMVLFGTGKFLEAKDRVLAQLAEQSFYGIWDKGEVVESRANLLKQEITHEELQSFTREVPVLDKDGKPTFDVDGKPVTTTETVYSGIRATSNHPFDNAKLGWYIDLLKPPGPVFEGEMQVTNSVLRNRRVIFTTQIPSEDPCAYGGNSWLMELDYISGGRLEQSPFDLNNDGLFTAEDYVKDKDGNAVPASGVKSDSGIWSQPAFLTSGQDEWLYLSTSNNKDQDGGCNEGTMDCKKQGVPANAYGRQSWRQVR